MTDAGVAEQCRVVLHQHVLMPRDDADDDTTTIDSARSSGRPAFNEIPSAG